MLLYDRQKEIDLKVNKTFTVIGCGGIGYWVAKFLAMSGVEKIVLYDDDVVDETNRNRLDFPEHYVGKNKAEVTKALLRHIRPDITARVVPFKFKESLFVMNVTTNIIDCTDNEKSQLINEDVAKRHNVEYCKAGYNGLHITVSNSIPDWGESVDGYTITPSWVVPSVISAALTVAKVLKFEKEEVSCYVNNLFIIR